MIREEFLTGRINKDTNLLDGEEYKESLKYKREVDANPLSCFHDLTYDPNTLLSLFFTVDLDLKDKIINQNQEDIEVLKKELIQRIKEISDLKEKIKENGVKKKNFCPDKFHAEKVHTITSTRIAKTSEANKSVHPDKVHTAKLIQADKSSSTAKTFHTIKRSQVVKTPSHLVKTHA
ncbi:unnamed protein product [Lactuca saligna]|uniref:Uncharacterized protein n=1 Tax=Lactuca saligna TaxID=75948 RepID=A0AA35ZA62_LACSI|nr:unnamed protein product [Lactuca saligna]